ncbi:hypothetical protein IQ268_08895 [Oculatella sp. LEGE 06141]|uniref:hypothetical protein n=1 Tax=Oculatella sp. LEGE 06141 TaxID=1828648 RepID=UPI001882E769|nr:hypothetical protein [Oculatella sp. LEGE 06141]MBE9178675.1 hypothetical protein [Oculatella sp. LEGE 06141]
MASKGGSWKGGKFKPTGKTVERLTGDNNIVPFTVRERKRLLGQLQSRMDELQGLGAQATKAIDRQNAKNVIESTLGSTRQSRERQRQLFRESLEQSLNPRRVGRTEAKIAAINKQIFETANPRKLVRVPRGTTQREYAEIVSRLASGDRAAIRQYTVPRPKGYRTAGDRRMQRDRRNSSQ